MCGITGYLGKREAYPFILSGLKRLEYRGYDSAGIAVLNNNKLKVIKCKGRIRDLERKAGRNKIPGFLGIGHTRWATHGKPSNSNAHPHTDCGLNVAVVHNGIIENFDELKTMLAGKGCKFKSDTDTEVIAHLIGMFYKGSLELAVLKAVKMLKGSYALGVIGKDDSDKLVCVRCGSPLVIGLGSSGVLIASDTSAFLDWTNKVVYLEDNRAAVITPGKIEVKDFNGRERTVKFNRIAYSGSSSEKSGFKHFMLKEISEQPSVIRRIIKKYTTNKGMAKFEGLKVSPSVFKKAKHIIIVACGTAYHSGLSGKYIIEKFARIPVSVDIGSEFRYRNPIIQSNSLVIAVSQSGETADTLAAVKEAERKKCPVISICNVAGSTLARESDAVIYTQAGPEISVASTKAYTAQLTVIYLLSLYLAHLKGKLNRDQLKRLVSHLKKVPSLQDKILSSRKKIKDIAGRHLNYGAFLFLGRGINYPTALEGALKLKEVSYIPAEGYPAGEMKHGPIALIDEYRAVVCILNKSFLYKKVLSNLQEILARRGKVIAIATEGDIEIKKYTREVIFVPDINDDFSVLLTVVPLQLLAYYTAVFKNYDVDKPRNLAKSVTVE